MPFGSSPQSALTRPDPAAASRAVPPRPTLPRRLLALALTWLALSALSPAIFAANDLILRIEGSGSSLAIPGESTLANHVGEIDCTGFSWGVQRSSSTANANFFTVTKRVDKASPLLMLGVFQGTHYTRAKFFVRTQGASPYDFFVVTMTDVVVVSQSTSAASDGSMVESISVSFASIKFDYQQLNSDGTTNGGVISAGWNVQTNTKL